MEDDYPWGVGRTGPEREFLACLRRLANDRALFDVWTFYPQLVVTLDIADPDQNAVIRTVRVDFDGSALRGGTDRSHQIDPDLDSDDPDYFEHSGNGSPAELAEYAFEWFRRESRRPIDRQAWFGSDRTWLLWVLIEPVERPLVARYFNRPDRPPDRVVRLDPRPI